MAELRTDRELIRDYVGTGSETAFSTIVERHVDLVYATAWCSVKNSHTAEEITQVVFTILARKGPWLAGDISLAGWLHKTAAFEARAWWRSELRRRAREQTAIEIGTTMKDENSSLKSLAAELDDALLSLQERDRQAVLLRYFEGRSHREIGDLLNAREDAVRMRIQKALDRLAVFFRRRGYKVVAVAAVSAVLEESAKAAPAGLGIAVGKSAAAAGSAGAATGLKLMLARWLSLSKTQMAAACLGLALLPSGVEWNLKRISAHRISVAQIFTDAARARQVQLSSEIERLQGESARLDAAAEDAQRHQEQYAAAREKLRSLKQTVPGLLKAPGQQWPADLPYVRIPKTVVHSLDLLHRSPGTFSSSGRLSEPAVELFGITADERQAAEKALADYWQGVKDMMAASAYETNSAGGPEGRITKTMIVPPLGEPLKKLAEATRGQLVYLLGEEREKLLFDGWEQGGIQFFWPGNLWPIADQPQTLSAWVEPSTTNSRAWFGASWGQVGTGIGSEGAGSLKIIPASFFDSHFREWASNYAIEATQFPSGGSDD
jgi:RNA polymerase sigma factor (sigma-70 family)